MPIDDQGSRLEKHLRADGDMTRMENAGFLRRLEEESIYIFREVAAQFRKPVMLYSIGKDSSVLLHLAQKAFYPSALPIPLLHVDTGWKFREMIEFRARRAAELSAELIVYTNEEGRAAGITPFSSQTDVYTDVMKTQALKRALSEFEFDAAIGGARRDEERSRAKERIFSFRDARQTWDPRRQRPEPWRLYNGLIKKGESIRVFPLSNWTERDVWRYIEAENIPVVPLYFAQRRPVVERDGLLIMVDDDRFRLKPAEQPELREIRFRTLGCYPLTGAVESTARTVPEILDELAVAKKSERTGRAIDYDQVAAMERKKRNGYF
jgi:sulfate adenylyltransferase subunit 2